MSDMMAAPLALQLHSEPQRFAFAQIIDLLEQLDRLDRGRTSLPMGKGSDPAREAVRLSGAFGLAFKASPIASLTQDHGAHARSTLAVNFFGLGAAQGPLPEAYVELVTEQLRRQAHAAPAFLDLFQHRLLSFVYRSENEFRFAAPFGEPRAGAYMPALNALLGLDARRPDHDVLSPILLAHALLVVQQRRSMSGLLALLGSHFGHAVTGSEFAGGWIDLPDELQTVLGEDGRNDLLGEDAVVGSYAWDPNCAIAVRFAPVALALYLAFLVGGRARKQLDAIIGYYLGPQVRCYVTLELETLPPGATCAPDHGAHIDDLFALDGQFCLLGYTSWLQCTPALPIEADRCATFVVNAAPRGRL